MQRLPLDRLGPGTVDANTMRFGLLLPWISRADGYRIFVKIIHERDQFLQEIAPAVFELAHAVDPIYGDYWSAVVAIDGGRRAHARSAFGELGRYVYRYELRKEGTSTVIDWIIDPFAREFGVGKLSAFTLGYSDHVWSENEAAWKTPPLDELVVYELMLHEFAGSLRGAIELLDYLRDLGVNCLEVMPVSNVALVQDWGFLPIGLFGVDERFGNRKDFQAFVDEAHQRGIAIILDVVYGHTSSDFPYEYVYRELGFRDNPFMGPFAKDYFGCSTDWSRKLTQDFYFTANDFWLDAYHVDGFRYDCVPNYYAGGAGPGYADLVFSTYQLAKRRIAEGRWQRFADRGTIGLIQCAEQLEGPVDILENTYSNATWQNETLAAAKGVAAGSAGSLTELGHRLGLSGYPREVTANGDTIAKSAFQFIENHDHERFICHFGLRDRDDPLLAEGDRERWYELQPYLIGLLTARGIPMLWQGQELCENYFLPDSGFGRVMLQRPVRWDFFYDEVGRATIGLVRRLLKIRKESPHIQRGSHFFYEHWERYQSKGILIFSRYDERAFSVVALNFSDEERWVPFFFPESGRYREELHGEDPLEGVVAYEERWLRIPSNYGRIWTLEAPSPR